MQSPFEDSIFVNAYEGVISRVESDPAYQSYCRGLAETLANTLIAGDCKASSDAIQKNMTKTRKALATSFKGGSVFSRSLPDTKIESGLRTTAMALAGFCIIVFALVGITYGQTGTRIGEVVEAAAVSHTASAPVVEESPVEEAPDAVHPPKG